MAAKKPAAPVTTAPVQNHTSEQVTTTNSGGKPAETSTAQNAGTQKSTAGGEVSGAGSEPANIAPATNFDPSGAPVQIVPDVDPSHPAVDADPRAHTSVDQNRIDFNDPSFGQG